ncbi:hypothetical protein M1B72_19220 [Geomonas paludis]|uniref:Secreted protein n=1 Tax=Geomonas paludis TaxID=2740185 RepID=A0A6V8MRY3_9BACT|nr:hypothetical protein [Geomonas paludis]UPU35548.1 hypothetical protein M1B72_19220 [Geomonas paludis]GFO62878.1 hypothetical protein GMPD_07970 [Geomonas paludis]
MDGNTLIIIGLGVIVIVLAIAVFALFQRRQTAGLRGRFGSEYDRTLRETGSRARAEADLKQREKRVERLNIRELSPEDAARFKESWARVQTRFVDDPKGAVTEADQLLGDVMVKRGYPVGDFEQRAADISVEHPRVVEHYRAGHEIALRHAKGQATTEDLRQAMIHYRTLFTDLVGEQETPSVVLRKEV